MIALNFWIFLTATFVLLCHAETKIGAGVPVPEAEGDKEILSQIEKIGASLLNGSVDVKYSALLPSLVVTDPIDALLEQVYRMIEKEGLYLPLAWYDLPYPDALVKKVQTALENAQKQEASPEEEETSIDNQCSNSDIQNIANEHYEDWCAVLERDSDKFVKKVVAFVRNQINDKHENDEENFVKFVNRFNESVSTSRTTRTTPKNDEDIIFDLRNKNDLESWILKQSYDFVFADTTPYIRKNGKILKSSPDDELFALRTTGELAIINNCLLFHKLAEHKINQSSSYEDIIENLIANDVLDDYQPKVEHTKELHNLLYGQYFTEREEMYAYLDDNNPVDLYRRLLYPTDLPHFINEEDMKESNDEDFLDKTLHYVSTISEYRVKYLKIRWYKTAYPKEGITRLITAILAKLKEEINNENIPLELEDDDIDSYEPSVLLPDFEPSTVIDLGNSLDEASFVAQIVKSLQQLFLNRSVKKLGKELFREMEINEKLKDERSVPSYDNQSEIYGMSEESVPGYTDEKIRNSRSVRFLSDGLLFLMNNNAQLKDERYVEKICEKLFSDEMNNNKNPKDEGSVPSYDNSSDIVSMSEEYVPGLIVEIIRKNRQTFETACLEDKLRKYVASLAQSFYGKLKCKSALKDFITLRKGENTEEFDKLNVEQTTNKVNVRVDASEDLITLRKGENTEEFDKHTVNVRVEYHGKKPILKLEIDGTVEHKITYIDAFRILRMMNEKKMIFLLNKSVNRADVETSFNRSLFEYVMTKRNRPTLTEPVNGEE